MSPLQRCTPVFRLCWLLAVPLLLFGCSTDPTDTEPTSQNPLSPSQAALEPPPQLVLAWGAAGSADGEFKSPTGIATDSQGNVYVADSENSRVQKFMPDGTFITKWSGGFKPACVAVDEDDIVYVGGGGGVHKYAADGTLLNQWPAPYPSGIAAAGGLVYVSNQLAHKVQKFTTDGTLLKQWSTPYAFGIDTDAVGDVYVTDYVNHKVRKFTADGGFIGDIVTTVSSPVDVDVDAMGNIRVVSNTANRLIKTDANGELLASWNISDITGEPLHVPQGVVVDPSGYLYVLDFGNRVLKFAHVPPGDDDDDADDDDDDGGGTVLPPQPDVDPVIGAIGVFANADAMTCNLGGFQADAISSVYVVHTGTTGRTGSGFSAPIPPCMPGVIFVTDICGQPVCLGDSQTGLSSGYGSCLGGPVLVATILFITQGPTEPCCVWPVLPNPKLPGESVVYTDCSLPIQEFPLPGLYAVVNPDATCPCQSPTTQPRDWGRIRDLMRNN